MVISLIVVTGSSSPSAADESLPQPVEDGSTHSSIRDLRRILRYIPLRTHHHRLAPYYLSRREMVARDTHSMSQSERRRSRYRMLLSSLAFVSTDPPSQGHVCSMWQSYTVSCSESPHPLMLSEDLLCHAPNPDPTRLADPNRVRDTRPRTGTLYLIFFLKNRTVPVGMAHIL